MRRVASLAAALLLAGAAAPAQAAEPEVVCRFDRSLDEISGMTASIRHPGVLWVHEDSGSGPVLHAIDASTCAMLATLTVRGSQARDYEAVATGTGPRGESVIWLGDIGDNRDAWPTVELLRIREPRALRDRTVRAERFTFTYDDRPHDAEALLTHGSRVWVVTKQLAAGGLYALPDPLDPAAVNIATRVREETGLVTDGNVAPDGSQYVLRDYFDARLFTGLPPGEPGAVVDLPPQAQGEAIAFTADGSALLVASEGDRRLLRVALEAPSPDSSGSSGAPTPAPSTGDLRAGDASAADSSGGDEPALWSIVGAAIAIAAAVSLVIVIERRRP